MDLRGRRVAILLGPMFQDEEAAVPLRFLREKGASVEVISVKRGSLKGLYGRESIKVDRLIDEVSVSEYDALVIPGGRSPSFLRKNKNAVAFVRDFFRSGKLVAAICHGPQMLASAGLLGGKRITAYRKIKDEMIKAGAEFVDEPVVVDGNLITSREPRDLEVFNARIIELLEKGV